MNDFGRLLEREIPRLRRYARALTHDVFRADDLVQDTPRPRDSAAASLALR
jgi:RNA polymerase sigma-70 factor (ECF subfamily)